jgi:uncharacterized protein (TIGR03663 family)
MGDACRVIRAALRNHREVLAYGGITLFALVLRLVELADRPFQYDEGQIAYFSWRFSTTGDYRYEPVLHGPLTYYLTSLSFLAGGASDFTARLVPALAGTAIVLIPAVIRIQIGRTAALTASLFLAISPSFLYYSRFLREDIVVTALTLLLIAVGIRLFDQPRRWHPWGIGALLAASFATKESTFITVAIVGAGLLGAAASGWPVAHPLRALGWRPWLSGAVAFAFVFTALFSVLFTHPGGVVDGLYEGPKYWSEQHEVGRGSEQWPLYLAILAGHEWLVLLLGVVGVVAALRTRGATQLFLVWLFVAGTATYSYAGERFAWLVLQPLVALVLLAGVGCQALWTRWRRARLAMATLGAGATLVFAGSAVRTSFERGSDPRELLVVVHSAPDVGRVRDGVVEAARRDPTITLEVDVSEFSTYPWAWYFRDLKAAYLDMQQETHAPRGDLLLVTDAARYLDPDRFARYRGCRFVQRRWWVRDYSGLGPGSVGRWFTDREPWGELGSLDQWFYVRLPRQGRAGPSARSPDLAAAKAACQTN